jgi:hypothetical protein
MGGRKTVARRRRDLEDLFDELRDAIVGDDDDRGSSKRRRRDAEDDDGDMIRIPRSWAEKLLGLDAVDDLKKGDDDKDDKKGDDKGDGEGAPTRGKSYFKS